MTDSTEWRPVEGYPNYEVSRDGRVRRLALYGPPRELQQRTDLTACGYLRVALSRKGRQRRCLVHRVVAQAFLGAIPKGADVHHKDHDRTNNRAENLEILGHGENIDRSIGRPRKPARERLTVREVVTLRRRHSEGTPAIHLAREIGLGYQSMLNLLHGKTYVLTPTRT